MGRMFTGCLQGRTRRGVAPIVTDFYLFIFVCIVSYNGIVQLLIPITTRMRIIMLITVKTEIGNLVV